MDIVRHDSAGSYTLAADCDNCQGTGWLPGLSSRGVSCPVCGGTGYGIPTPVPAHGTPELRKTGNFEIEEFIKTGWATCEACGGELAPDEVCHCTEEDND